MAARRGRPRRFPVSTGVRWAPLGQIVYTYRTISNAGGNWDSAATWVEGIVPTAADVVVATATSGNVTINVAAACRALDLTSYVGTLTHAAAVTLSIGDEAAGVGNIALKFVAGMIYTLNNAATSAISFTSTSAVQQTVTTGGKVLGNVAFNGANGSWLLTDTLTATGGTLTVTSGVFNSGSQAINVTSFLSNGSVARVLTLGSSVITLTSTTGNPWNFIATGITFDAGTSQIIFPAASTTSRTFIGGGLEYNTLTYNVAKSPGALVITGSNTFNTLNVAAERILTLPATTSNGVSNWNASGQNNGYQRLPGASNNYVSAPDSAALSITDNIDMRIRVAMDDWTPSADMNLLSKDNEGGTQRSYRLYVQSSSGNLILPISDTGSNFLTAQSSVSLSTVATDGQPLWVRATYRQSDKRVQFFTAADSSSMPSSWTQLGIDRTHTATSIFDSTAPLTIGMLETISSALLGNVYRTQIRNNVLDDGTGIVFDADFTAKTFGTNSFTESSTNAATVTITGAAAQVGDGRLTINSPTAGTQATLHRPFTDAYSNKMIVAGGSVTFNADNVQLTGASGNYLWTKDAAAISVVNDFDYRFRASLVDWTPVGNQNLMGKRRAASSDFSHVIYVGTDGKINYTQSLDGVSSTNYGSTVSPTVTDGAAIWVRVTKRSSDGRLQFFTAADGASMPSSWTQLGTDHFTATGAIFDSTSPLELGSQQIGTSSLLNGKIYRAQIRNNILDDGTGIVYDFDGSQRANNLVSSYLTVQDSKAGGSGTWYAGATSVNVSNNTGWLFTNVPTVSGTANLSARGSTTATNRKNAVSVGNVSTPTNIAIASGRSPRSAVVVTTSQTLSLVSNKGAQASYTVSSPNSAATTARKAATNSVAVSIAPKSTILGQKAISGAAELHANASTLLVGRKGFTGVIVATSTNAISASGRKGGQSLAVITTVTNVVIPGRKVALHAVIIGTANSLNAVGVENSTSSASISSVSAARTTGHKGSFNAAGLSTRTQVITTSLKNALGTATSSTSATTNAVGAEGGTGQFIASTRASTNTSSLKNARAAASVSALGTVTAGSGAQSGEVLVSASAHMAVVAGKNSSALTTISVRPLVAATSAKGARAEASSTAQPKTAVSGAKTGQASVLLSTSSSIACTSNKVGIASLVVSREPSISITSRKNASSTATLTTRSNLQVAPLRLSSGSISIGARANVNISSGKSPRASFLASTQSVVAISGLKSALSSAIATSSSACNASGRRASVATVSITIKGQQSYSASKAANASAYATTASQLAVSYSAPDTAAGSAAINATASISSAGSKSVTRAVVISAPCTVFSSGREGSNSSGSATAKGSLTVSGLKTAVRNVTVATPSACNASSAKTSATLVSLSAKGNSSSTATKAAFRATNQSTVPNIAVTYFIPGSAYGLIAVHVDGTIQASGRKAAAQTVTLSTSSFVASFGLESSSNSASISAKGSVVVSSLKNALRPVSVSTSSSLSSSYRKQALSSCTLHSPSAITSTVSGFKSGAAQIFCRTSVAFSGLKSALGSASGYSTSTTTANGTRTTSTSLVITSRSTTFVQTFRSANSAFAISSRSAIYASAAVFGTATISRRVSGSWVSTGITRLEGGVWTPRAFDVVG